MLSELRYSYTDWWMYKWLIDWLIDWLNDWLIEWLNEWLIDWLIDWMIDWLNDWLNDWLIEWLIDWMIDWLIDWMIDWLNDWLIDWLIDWLNEWMIDWLIQSSYFTCQENLNCCGDPYSLATQMAIRQLSERDISFELITALLGYFRSLQTPGAVLIFLPGWNTIFTLMRFLAMNPVFGKGY